MKKNDLSEKAKNTDSKNIEDFVRANLHCLPEDKQRLFHLIDGLCKPYYQEKNPKIHNYRNNNNYQEYQKYQGDCYNGKS